MSLRLSDKDDPRPILGDTVKIICRNLKDEDGNKYDLSGVSKWYCIVKSSLATEDDSAEITINSTINATQFSLADAANGNLSVTLVPTDTDNLTAGTNYYLQFKGIYATGEIVTVVYEPEFIVVDRVVKSTS